MNSDLRICVIGAGKMGEALVHSLISKNAIVQSRLLAADVLKDRCEYISKRYEIECSTDVAKIAHKCNVIIIAVKPKDIRALAETIGKFVTSKQLVISIAAGVSSDSLSKILGSDIPVIRAMPNIAILVGEGMIALARGPNSTSGHMALAEKIFSYTGRVTEVDEKQMDAVTALSGSGPAYVYTIIDALSDGGVKVGLQKELATLLAAQTALGAAKMILETKEHPAKLRDMVMTPGGTTVEGILQLEKGNVRASLMEAIVKATNKSIELRKSQETS
nr:pyrroline-5-carboxylate reductase [Candidatus Njordarchaeum guaymaensis]